MILVPTLHCFARSLTELSATLSRLRQMEIRLISHAESIDIDLQTWEGAMLFHLLTVVMNAENSMIARNVRVGVARAQKKGTHCGRPRRRFPRAQARKLRKQGLSIRAIAARMGIPASTIAAALNGKNCTET